MGAPAFRVAVACSRSHALLRPYVAWQSSWHAQLICMLTEDATRFTLCACNVITDPSLPDAGGACVHISQGGSQKLRMYIHIPTMMLGRNFNGRCNLSLSVPAIVSAAVA